MAHNHITLLHRWNGKRVMCIVRLTGIHREVSSLLITGDQIDYRFVKPLHRRIELITRSWLTTHATKTTKYYIRTNIYTHENFRLSIFRNSTKYYHSKFFTYTVLPTSVDNIMLLWMFISYLVITGYWLQSSLSFTPITYQWKAFSLIASSSSCIYSKDENNNRPSSISDQFNNLAAHFLVYLTYFRSSKARKLFCVQHLPMLL